MKMCVFKKVLPFILIFTLFVTSSWKTATLLPVKEEKGIVDYYKEYYNIGMKFTMYGALYDSLELDIKGLPEKAFVYALEGFEEMQQEGKLLNDSVVTIIDFDQPSVNKRLYVIDIKNNKLLFNTWAAHGKNTGALMAAAFGNTLSSNKSSLGFYLTESTYYGGNGYSLKLVGLERGLNDRAMQRAIVMHGADYVSESTISQLGYLGRSFGCPAVSRELNRPIIDQIKGGSVLFIFHSSYKPKTIKWLS